MKAFVLAGGFATRLWPLTEKRAKPLLPLAGVPLLTHLVEKIPAGIPITVSTNQIFAEDFKRWKVCHGERSRTMTQQGASLDSARDDTSISILIEDAGHEDEKLGALGAVAKWIREENIDDDVLLLAGDNYMGFSIEEFLKEYHGKVIFAAYDLHDKEQAKQFGIVTSDNKIMADFAVKIKNQRVFRAKANGFEEKPSNPSSTFVSTGCYILPADSLVSLVEYAKDHPDNIGGVLNFFLKEGKEIEYVIFKDIDWFDIGSFNAYLGATKKLVGENFLLGEGAVQKESELTGSIVFGKNSKVARSSLHNVVLFENCEVEDCVLENCIVDDDCILRGVDLSGKMLRAGTILVRGA